jgi:hypothetical protein
MNPLPASVFRPPPPPPDPLIPWQRVRAEVPFICELRGPEVIAALQQFRTRSSGDVDITLFYVPDYPYVGANSGVPLPTWIDWTGFPPDDVR